MLKGNRFFVLFFIGMGQLFAQAPVANFSADVTMGCGNLLTNFTDLSTNNPTSWSWDFGNTTTSTLKNPTAFYSAPGTYTVRLTATNATGSDSETKTAYIKVVTSPVPLFVANSTTVCAGATINFTDQSVVGDGPIVSWLWDFGDGGSSTSQNASHTYPSSGFYTVSLSITDNNGCLKKLVKTNYIVVNTNPVAGFSGSPLQFCTVPTTVNFISTSTGNGLSYQWNFGDGGSSNSANPAHAYSLLGIYSVSLTVTNSSNCSNRLVQSNYVQITDFQADFSATPTVGCDVVNAVFTDASTAGAVSWQWNFGDGNTSTQQNPTNNYQTDGLHTVRLIATNSIGCIDTIIKTNYITVNSLPAVSFSANKTDTCGIPYTIQFTSNSAEAVQWSWDFGDTSASTQQNPLHTYSKYNSYGVSLTVTNAAGCINSFIVSDYIHINAPKAIIAKACGGINPLPFKGCIPVDADPRSCSQAGSGGTLNSWQWKFDNGNTSNLEIPPTQTYSLVGVYTATLTVGTSNGCFATRIDTIARAGTVPTANFTSTFTVGCYPLTIQFTDLSTPSPNVNEWQWQFGDGGIVSAVQNPSHTYLDTGYFSVTLTAYYNGCPDIYSVSNYIHVLPPKTLFDAVPLVGCFIPLPVTFLDASQGANTWRWDFGDGNTNTDQNPSHSYVASGNYSVKLVTTNTVTGCRDSLTESNYIQIANTLADFTVIQNGVCPPSTAAFTDNTVSNVTVQNWRWDFGDGHTASGGDVPIPFGYDGGLTTGSSFKNPVHTYNTSGTFSVTLTATDQLSCNKFIIKAIDTIRPLPTPVFAGNPTTDCRPMTVAFTNSSYTASPGNITQYTWDYGDGGAPENTANPVHLYSSRGSYAVTLSVTDDFGCSNTLVKTNYINPTFPYSNFSFSSTVCNDSSFQIVNLTTPESGLTYLWDFGDGGTSSAAAPLYSYSVDSTMSFNIMLKATDANGCDSSITKTITVALPEANFGASARIADCPPFIVQFNDSSSSNVVSWQWDFGDGSSSTLKNPLHTYSNGGRYTVRLISSTAGGCTDTMEISDMIIVGGPSGSFTFSPSTGCAPLTVYFVATASKTEIYQWVFDDGSTALGNPVSHTYNQAGTFNPILLITDSLDGIGDSIRCIVQIPSPDGIYIPGPVINFSSDTSSCSPTTVDFSNLTSPVTGTETWLWAFGDGDTSNAKDPSHYYALPGVYSVTLTVTVNNCTYMITKENYFSVFDTPQIKAELIDTIGCTPYSVKFSVDTTTVTYPVGSWMWDFGDEGSSTDRDPVHIYTTGGIYSVSLTVVFTNSCTATYSADKTITVYNSPLADFNLEAVIAGNYISSIKFYNQSQGAISYLWNFDDGNSSSEVNPEHTYNSENTYDIELIAFSQDGCTDTAVKTTAIYSDIRMPNIFTPDGDGVNDYFSLLIPGIINNFNLTVYDKWGKVVYQSDNYQNDWTGTDKNNKPVDDGTYYYLLKYDEKYMWYGWVMILGNN